MIFLAFEFVFLVIGCYQNSLVKLANLLYAIASFDVERWFQNWSETNVWVGITCNGVNASRNFIVCRLYRLSLRNLKCNRMPDYFSIEIYSQYVWRLFCIVISYVKLTSSVKF